MFKIVEEINEEENELNMENISTIVTTIVSIGQPREKNEPLLSEKLLLQISD